MQRREHEDDMHRAQAVHRVVQQNVLVLWAAPRKQIQVAASERARTNLGLDMHTRSARGQASRPARPSLDTTLAEANNAAKMVQQHL